MSNRRLLLMVAALTGAVVVLLVLSVGRLQPEPPDPAEKWRPKETWDAGRAREVLDRARDLWTDSLEALRAGRIDRARRLYADSDRLIDPWLQAYPGEEITNGVSLQQHIQRVAEAYRRELTAVFTEALKELAKGRESPRDIRRFLASFDFAPSLRDRYEAQKEDIMAARTTRASNWFRVMISGHPGYEWVPHVVEDAFRDKWRPPETDRELVFGGPLSLAEKEATWQTLVITTTVQTADFRVQKDTSFSEEDWTPPTLPLGIELYFQRAGRTSVTTSWDTLAPMYTWLEPPPAISKSMAPRFLESYRHRIRANLQKELEGIPPFRVE